MISASPFLAIASQVSKTAWCSTVVIAMRGNALERLPKIARLILSVAPDVQTISLGEAPIKSAT
jgi:hypothetical protein